MEALLTIIGVLALIPALLIYNSFSWGWVLYSSGTGSCYQFSRKCHIYSLWQQ